MPRWLRAGLCGLVAVERLAGCSGVSEPEAEAPTTMEPRGPLTFELLVNALPPEAGGPLGLPHKAGCPGAGTVKCAEVDAIENDSVSGVWGPTERPKREAWIRPYVLLQVSEFPDEASAAHMVEGGRASYAPEFDGVFDIPAEPAADRERLGNRGQGVVYGDPGLAGNIGSDLSEQAQSAGLHLVDALVVNDSRWARIGTSDELAELDAVPDQLSGMVTAGDQFSGAELPEPDAELAAAAAAVAARLSVASDPLGPGALLTLFEAVLDEPIERLTAHDWADLVWYLARPALRDVALMQWAGDQEAGLLALQAQLAWEDGTEYPSDLARVMWGEGARPDPKRLERALAV